MKKICMAGLMAVMLICTAKQSVFAAQTKVLETAAQNETADKDTDTIVELSEEKALEEKRAEIRRTIQEQEEERRALAEKKAREEEEERQAREALERQQEEERIQARQELVDYALQFVGNPYVYGGTSLTQGADCSGFVQSVFRDCGYGELPRVASAQFESSSHKELDQLETGDLVFYGDSIYHVAIYMGDGKVVHASNSRTGITISDYDYMPPSCAGTYLA